MSTQTEGRPLTESELARISEKVHELYPETTEEWLWLIQIDVTTGLRGGELVRLSWDASADIYVDMSKPERPVLVFKSGKTKGKVAARIPCGPEATKLLQSVPERRRKGLVCEVRRSPLYFPMSHDALTRAFSELTRAAGVITNDDGQHATLHDLRRTALSRWALKLAPAVLMTLARHKSIQTTMKYYVHLDEADVSKALWG